MYIENEDTIVFKSIPVIFEKEKSCKKPNTVRIISEMESDKWNLMAKVAGEIYSGATPITKIKIQCSVGDQYFIRKLKDVTVIPHEGTALWIFSWRH